MPKELKDICDAKLRHAIITACDAEASVLAIAEIVGKDMEDESGLPYNELRDLADKIRTYTTWFTRELIARGAHK